MRESWAIGDGGTADLGTDRGPPARGRRTAHAQNHRRFPRPDLWIATFLGTRRQDGTISDADAPASLGWSPFLALACGFALIAAAFAANASRLGESGAVPAFYAAIAAIFLPSAVRILSPRTSRLERMTLITMVTAALFVVRVIRAPVAFIDHDEFLHAATANGILEAGRLFLPNPLLPVSPLYPGLELVTTALVNASGLSVFAAALIILAAARLTLMLTLFLFFESITHSTRIASIACLVFMGSSAFLIFDLHFSYESLAVPILTLVLLASTDLEPDGTYTRRHLACVMLPLIVALALTHHLTSFFAAGILSATACVECLRASSGWRQKRGAIVLAILAVAMPLMWSKFVGDPTGGYIGPVLESGVQEVAQLVSQTAGRALFTSDSGAVAPAWQRYLTMGGVLLVCLGLLTGFLRACTINSLQPGHMAFLGIVRRRVWTSSALIVFTVLTLAYPVSIVFRLTRSGWEIGNRIGSLSFFGVAIVVAIAIAGFWQNRSPGRVRQATIAGGLAVIVIAGIISSEGPRILVPAQYEVSGDSSSIEPMGISAANWTREWLGPGHLFATDRINRLLLSTYGRQTVATTLENWRDTSVAILSPRLGSMERALLIQSAIDYVMVDLRITRSLPGVGVYFDGGAADRHHKAPPKSAALLKFNTEPTADRIFDDGYIILFDVRRLAP